jgi:hypothetical protein
VFIRHESNLSSGGKVTDSEIGAFLREGQQNAEHQGFLRLIGTLVDDNDSETPAGQPS